MKRFLAIFLILQFFTSNAFAEELLRLPRLFTHYIHHSQDERDVLNFADFIQKHYSEDHEHAAHPNGHDDDDCNLPFKHCSSSCSGLHITTIGFPSSSVYSIVNLPVSLNAAYHIENYRIESLDICTIWQPPKMF